MVKIGHTHTQDATPLTLGQEWSAYAGMLTDDLERIVAARDGVYRLALGGSAVGAGINSAPGLAEALELAPQQRRQKTLEAPTAPTATENAGSADGTTAGVPGLRSIDDHSEPVKTQSQNEGEYP